jgi:hypothetical protein
VSCVNEGRTVGRHSVARIDKIESRKAASNLHAGGTEAAPTVRSELVPSASVRSHRGAFGVVVEIHINRRQLTAPTINPLRPLSQLRVRIRSPVLRTRRTMKTKYAKSAVTSIGIFISAKSCMQNAALYLRNNRNTSGTSQLSSRNSNAYRAHEATPRETQRVAQIFNFHRGGS